MSRVKAKVASIAAVYALAALISGWWVYRFAYVDHLAQLEETGRIRVQQASDRLMGQLSGYVYLVNLLADHPAVVAGVVRDVRASELDDLLEQSVLTYGADDIVVADAKGGIVAASAPDRELLPVADTLLRAALNGRLGVATALDGSRRLFRLSRGVIDRNAPAVGAVLVTLDAAALEFEWGVDPEAICFFDRTRTVLAATRQSLLMRQDGGPELANPAVRPFPRHSIRREGEHEIWSFPDAAELPTEALVVSRTLPQIEMVARGFLDTAPARTAAMLRGLLATAMFGVIGLAGLIAALWRRRMADRLAIESAANARLEERVEQRTAELRVAQDQLVQASKLSALGEMSAGISHELNQPLATIRNFAENGLKFLERGRTDEVRDNLGRISGQVQRIDQIIRNLRSFARKEDENVEPVDLVRTVEHALSLSRPNLEKEGIRLSWDAPSYPVLALGGEIRLQQVIVNILSNAQDALAGAPDKRIRVTLDESRGDAVLSIADSGPGIPEPARVFEPFYTTKELGASKGLGLGLSISYGIIGSFGGELSCTNQAGGGAVFTIRLPLADGSSA
ncbi:ATP-binding protein [Nisaea acidiphila]|uniref:C4-dicarboxylate transport sensor protein DctB n=1 Tax=Nisaea acidiphila TaxID=1862145 RepID=A0A9J7ARA2_9PROT|nr:ATP-binding protein [Nisaea acidiphila]UUX49402.1 ATP-binding protein [Nisaea acidiphila]